MTNSVRNLKGKPVSEKEVIAALGKPSAKWEREARKLVFQNLLRRDQTDLDIAGIRGKGIHLGYLNYLERSLIEPHGTKTGLISSEESQRIHAELKPEIQKEIDKYRLRLAELETSPDAVTAYIEQLKSWLEYIEKDGPQSISKQPTPELRQLAEESNVLHFKEVALLEADIHIYTERLKRLQTGTQLSLSRRHHVCFFVE